MKVLIVEGDRGEARDLANCLYDAGYDYEIATDGIRGLARLRVVSYAVALVEFILPRISGLELIRRMRLDRVPTPAIILSSLGDVADKVAGLNAGADDSITKPFSMEELLFRIEAILRRVKGNKGKDVIAYKIGGFTFDVPKQSLTYLNGTPDKLTTKESDLLSLLCSHANDILERNFALKTIWIDDNYFNARSMDVYITKLRKKLKEDENIEIINIHGKGYKLVAPDIEAITK